MLTYTCMHTNLHTHTHTHYDLTLSHVSLLFFREMTEAYASYSVGLSEFYLQEADSCAEDITDMIQAVQQVVLL